MTALVLPPAELLAKTKRAILFSEPLVPRVLDGSKDITRRLDRAWLKYPPGTLLYVAETLVALNGHAFYRAGAARCWAIPQWEWQRPVLPSIHMPRLASRCVIRLTEPPRLERVDAITEEEAKREGVGVGPRCDDACATPHRCGFIDTWHRLHTKKGQRWQDGPEVVRIAFERVTGDG